MPQASDHRDRPVSPLALAGLLGLVAAVYWPVVGFEFVNWDDPWYVLHNPLITSWRPSNLWRIATEMSVKNYAPLTTLSLLVDHTLFGLHAGGYHVMNVLLHAINAVLVCCLMTRLTSSRSVGLIVAAMFAVHPVQIETVAWVSSRKTLLSGTFMLASALCWLRSERDAKQELWGTAWLALALLAKAAAIVVPPIVLAYDMLVRRRTFAEALPRQLLPGLLCLLMLNVTMSAQATEMGGVRGHLELDRLHILAVDAVILWKYVGMLIWPTQLSLLYDPPITGIALPVLLATAGWLTVAATCWRWRQRFPLLAFAVATWILLLLPVLNLIPITTLMNDRYLYLPCVCVFALAAGAVEAAWTAVVGRNCNLQIANCKLQIENWRMTGRTATAAPLNLQFAIPDLQFAIPLLCVAVVVATYASLSVSHLPVWRNDFALWSHTMSRVPQLPVVQIQWADALHREGETEQAAEALCAVLAADLADEGDRERIQRRLSEWGS